MRARVWLLCSLITLTAPAFVACSSDSGSPTGGGGGDDGTGGGGSGGGGDNGGGGSGGVDAGGGGGMNTPDGGSDQAACAAPGAVGNEQGVGEYCTPGGGECDDNDGAGICTVDFQSDAPPFCTEICFSDDDCGSDSVCTDNGGGPKGCVPSCVVGGGA